MNENKDAVEVVRNMLLQIGEDPHREGLSDTPERVARMWEETFRGYKDPVPKVTTFSNNKDGIHYDQIIFDSGYYFSFCEHHMLPFFGQYYFAYVPSTKVLGLSKVARIVDHFSAKLQVQERLTKEIVDELEISLTDDEYSQNTNSGKKLVLVKPKAIGLVLKGRHLCKEMRGVKKINGEMITSDLRGAFRDEPETRAEFLAFIK